MPNRNYLAGRRAEWSLQKLFRDAGYTAMRTAGSHSWADVIVCRPLTDDVLAMTRPITIDEMDEVLDGYMDVPDRKLLIDGFLYGRKQVKARGGEVMLHMTPATTWMLQLKSTKGR